MLEINTHNCQKPRNFSRKVFICTCECNIIFTDTTPTTRYRPKSNLIDKAMVKYEIEPNQDFHYNKLDSKKYWSSPTSWGKFKKIVELPKIFEKLDDDEYIVKTGVFTRDSVLMPCIFQIEILNVNKYLNLKKQEERKKKLKNINKN